ncbi:MAG: hypothetical protein A2286_14200 [Gammaproteobacteria bacterium RIFOXYA12_FULL_61_12]|nr:MAG: hypothetical protein A2514_05970 [Gammaproteobacteria bacterium RIFOXYD12_FULL_61_37]OGT93437.1 MAG: hypothetical protein A2286_14200 [Gammaproteobacteria bacterium RIFOXYA12_FULL_61_12]
MSDPGNKTSDSDRRKTKVEISDIEADMAYFDARITMIGSDPETPYQKAQLKTYRILEKLLQESLEKKRKEISGK